jgi:hypothetical protein
MSDSSPQIELSETSQEAQKTELQRTSEQQKLGWKSRLKALVQLSSREAYRKLVGKSAQSNEGWRDSVKGTRIPEPNYEGLNAEQREAAFRKWKKDQADLHDWQLRIALMESGHAYAESVRTYRSLGDTDEEIAKKLGWTLEQVQQIHSPK